MSFPAYGASFILCGNVPCCKWSGRETELQQNEITEAGDTVRSYVRCCPKCGGDSFSFVKWKPLLKKRKKDPVPKGVTSALGKALHRALS